jgi:hypothetical protein
VLFQQFVPGNDHDIRVTVIGDRSFAFKRAVRDGDFRASGSGKIVHLSEAEMPRDAVAIARRISERLGFQSMSYDFVRTPDRGGPVLLEMSFVFQAEAVHDCPGHLDREGRWHEGHVWPQDAILEDLLLGGGASRMARD